MDAATGIRAGVAWLFHKAARYGGVQVAGPPQTHTVQPGDTFESVAEQYGSHPKVTAKANPKVKANNLRVGKQLTVPPGEWGVTGWDTWEKAIEEYNGRGKNAGDPEYLQKVKTARSALKASRSHR